MHLWPKIIILCSKEKPRLTSQAHHSIFSTWHWAKNSTATRPTHLSCSPIFFQKFYFIDAVVVVDNFDNLIARQIFQQEIDKNSSNEVPPSIPFYFYLYLPTFISTSLDLFINLPTISTSIPISTYVYIYLPTNLPGTSIYLSTYL